MIPVALTLPGTSVTDTSAPVVTMDEAAFRRLYHHTARSLRAYLIRACGDLALADDLLQEAYLRFLRSGFEGEDDEHRKNYLFRIATNAMRDHFRRKRPESGEVPEKDDTPPHDAAVHLRSDVGGAMSELSATDRQMLWLAYVEGGSHDEIAAALGLRSASIRSMLFRARRRLAEKLRDRGLAPREETA
jgi:RNA polymerase sigma-70 factor (ECF subfamily)